MATWTGTRALNSLTGDITDNGRTLTTPLTPQFGDGTTATRITHFTGEFIDKTVQWDLAANTDGSPVLEIGTPNFPTYVYDTFGNADWANGGQLDAVSGFPLVVIRNTNWRVENAVDSSAFAGNLQDVNTHAEWCTFSWSRTTHVPFFGRANIFRNTVFAGAGSGSGLANFGPFLGFTIDTTNVLVRDFFLGFKAEYGQPSWLRGFQWSNCASDAHNWTTSSNTSGGTSDGAMNLQDCTTTKNKVTAGNNGWIKVWRTLSGRTADAAGSGVSGAVRYALWGSSGTFTPYAETYTVNASAQASFYQTESTTIAGFTTTRNELAYYFQPNERVRIAGFTNTALNGDFTVQGRPYTVGLAQGNFRDKTQLWVAGKNAATEATKSITFTVLPPISSASGTYSDYKVQIIDARALDTIGDGAGFNFAGARSLTQLLANNGAWAGFYERTSWRVVEIPPYPYQRQVQDFNIAPFADTPGAKIEWNTLALNDAQITITNAATVGAYTTLETAAKVYDYAEWWKRQTANHALPNLFTGICTRSGSTLNFGALNVVVDATASTPLAFNSGTSTVTIKAATYTGNITTTGTVTLANGAIINGSYTDSTGTRVTIRTADNLPLTTRILINGVDQGEVVEQTSRNIFVGPSTQVRIFAIAYGYQPKIINVTGNTASDYVISLVPETNVDTTLNTTTRDTILAAFATGIDGFSRIFLSVNTDLRQYAPADVLNALHRFMVVSGGTVAAAALAQNNVDGFALMRGGFIIRSAGFYGKVADSVTTVGNLGVLVPLSIYVDPSVYTAMPTYTAVEKNTSGIVLQYAPWTQQEADVPAWVAKEATVASRLAASSYTPAPTAAANASAVRTELAAELGQVSEVHAIHGLDAANPMTVTPTTRVAGTISQTISGNGTTTSTVQRV